MGIHEPLECNGTVATYGRSHVTTYTELMFTVFEDTKKTVFILSARPLTDKRFACVKTGVNMLTPTKLRVYGGLSFTWTKQCDLFALRVWPNEYAVWCCFYLKV